MSNYFLGVLVAFLEPVFHGWCNVFDSYLSNELFPKLTTLIFFGTLFSLLLLPIVFFIDPPHLLPLWALGLVGLISLIEVLYNFPYYWALRHTDTSIVTSLFSVGRIFVPILAFFIVGERLTFLQYAGFFLIVLSATALNFDTKKFRLNPAFFLMLGVCFVLAIQTISYKYIFEHGVSWGSVVATMTIFEIAISLAVLFISGALVTFKKDVQTIISNWRLFSVNELFGWIGNMGDSFAVSVLPASVARSIGSTQALFVLAYAFALRNRAPRFSHEYLDNGQVPKKIGFFVLIIIGTVLVVLGKG